MEILNINTVYMIIGLCYIILSLGLITFYIVNDGFPKNGLEFGIAVKSGLLAIIYLIGGLILGVVGAIFSSVVLLVAVIVVPIYYLLLVLTNKLLKV